MRALALEAATPGCRNLLRTRFTAAISCPAPIAYLPTASLMKKSIAARQLNLSAAQRD
jgi:hypothetical protein